MESTYMPMAAKLNCYVMKSLDQLTPAKKKGVKVASSNKVKKKNETLTKIAFPSPFFFFLFGYLNKKGNICAPNKQLRIIWVAKK